MDLTKLKTTISHIHDTKVLWRLREYIDKRRKIENAKQHKQMLAEAWAAAKQWSIGQTIYCCMDGFSLGGGWQCGDSGKLTYIQPRAKRIWLRRDGKDYWFEPAGILRYKLQATPPEKPPSEELKRFWNKAGEVIQEVIK